jgi:hypothetical protein
MQKSEELFIVSGVGVFCNDLLREFVYIINKPGYDRLYRIQQYILYGGMAEKDT